MELLAKKLCDLSKLTIDNYKDLLWQASQGKAAFLTPDLVHSQCTADSERSCSQGLSLL